MKTKRIKKKTRELLVHGLVATAIIMALLLGFVFGTLFAFEQLGRLGNEVLKDSEISVDIDLNETPQLGGKR